MNLEDHKRDQFVETVRYNIDKVADNLIHLKDRYGVDMWDDALDIMHKKRRKVKMELEELIVAIDASTLDSEASAEIVEILIDKLLEIYPQAKEYFTVLETCKEDILYKFTGTSEIRPKIDKLTDEQMEHIAEDVGYQLLEHYWEALELAVKAELEEEQ